MNLGTLINTLQDIGNQFNWYGIETNIESVDLFESIDGKYKVKLRAKED